MTFPRLAASLVAVAIFLGPVNAQDQGQPEDGAATEMTKAILPPAVKAMLLDTRPTGEFSDKELNQRLALARKFQALPGLNDDVRLTLETAAASAEEELARRQSAVSEDNQQPAQELLPIGTQVPEDVLAYVKTPANPAGLSDEELKARHDMGREMLAREGWPSDILDALKGQVSSYRREMVVRQAAAGQQQPEMKKAANPEFTTAEDTAALKLINDRRPAKTMALKELRERVRDARRLLKSPKLSPAVKDQLLDKMTVDRNQLRLRMAAAQGVDIAEDVLPDSNPPPQATAEAEQDTRAAESLDDNDLRARIKALSAVKNRPDLETRLTRDRQALRQRLLKEKAERRAQLKKPDKVIVLNLEPAPQEDLTAAEAAPDELEDILVSAPRRKAQRHYSLEEFERSPELRAAVPRIEIDTIRFGFNESFIREEEIDELDRVAYIIERILASNPYEVFLIEGHTDASGSDSYNLGLSRARARAVVEALTTFYVIPPQNLRAIGYGERYLKIPVPYAEAENRRVSVSRVTDFLAFQ